MHESSCSSRGVYRGSFFQQKLKDILIYFFFINFSLIFYRQRYCMLIVSYHLLTLLSSRHIHIRCCHFLSPVSCDLLELQGLRCEWGAGCVKFGVIALKLVTGSSTWHLMAKNSIVALHKDGIGYKKFAKTLKLSCSTVAKTIQRFNRTGSTKNRPRHGLPKKLSARAQRHIQRFCLGNRRMSAASIVAEVEGVGGQPVSAQTRRRTLHRIGLHGCCPRMKPLLMMMHF